MRLKIFDVILGMVLFSLFRIYFIPININRVIKIVSLVLVILFMVKNVKEKKYYFNVISLLSFCIIISSLFGYINNFINVSLFLDSLVYSLYLTCTFIMIKYGIDNNMERNIINILYYLMLFYYIASLLSISFVGTAPVLLLQYFAGNKFLTSYYLFFFCIMFSIKYNVPSKRKITFLCLIIFTLYICYHINCSTAVVSGMFLFLIYFKNINIKNILMKQKTLFITFILSGLFLLFLQKILNINFVSHFIVDVLHKNLTLTGRTQIYNSLPTIIKFSPIVGYGYGNQVISSVVGYGNAQNAIFQFIIQFGFLGLLTLILVFLKSFSIKRDKKNINIWPFYVYIYVILVCSTVEISFNYMFFIVLFIIYAFNSEKFNKVEKGR